MHSIRQVFRFYQSRYEVFLSEIIPGHSEAFASEIATVYDLQGLASEDSSWKQRLKAVSGISGVMIDVYHGVLQRFSASDCCHYLFTPRMLTQWIKGLKRYGLHGSAGVLDAVYHEGCRIFKDRLMGVKARVAFEDLLVPALMTLGFSGAVKIQRSA